MTIALGQITDNFAPRCTNETVHQPCLQACRRPSILIETWPSASRRKPTTHPTNSGNPTNNAPALPWSSTKVHPQQTHILTLGAEPAPPAPRCLLSENRSGDSQSVLDLSQVFPGCHESRSLDCHPIGGVTMENNNFHFSCTNHLFNCRRSC